MTEKDPIWQVVNTVFSLEVSKGHLKWKVTDLARYTGMNRSLIYYYLGKNKSKIFDTCLEMVADEFYGLSESRLKIIHSGRKMDCVQMSREMFQINPEFMVFYFKWRMKKSTIQNKLIEIETRYQKKLKAIFTHLNDHEIVALHSLIQGAVISPFVDNEIFEIALKMIISGASI